MSGAPPKRKFVPRDKGKHAQARRPSVKNQIRSITRLLARPNVPQKLREEKQRELEKLERQGRDNKRVEREKKLSTRYHKVKFFERVKLTRRIAQLEREKEGGAGGDDAEAELSRLREDLEYVTHFPRGEKYVSVLVSDGDTEHATKERERLRRLVKTNLAAEAALADENEGGADMAANAGAGEEDNDDFLMNDSGDDGEDGGGAEDDSDSDSDSSTSSSSSSGHGKKLKPELKMATDPIYIKNPAQKLLERSERKQNDVKVDKDGNKLPQRTRAEGGRKRRKK